MVERGARCGDVESHGRALAGEHDRETGLQPPLIILKRKQKNVPTLSVLAKECTAGGYTKGSVHKKPRLTDLRPATK